MGITHWVKYLKYANAQQSSISTGFGIGNARRGSRIQVAFNDTSKALLGDDFISCCIFNHGFKNDIIVTAFNFDEYEKQYLHSAGLMDIFEVFSLN